MVKLIKQESATCLVASLAMLLDESLDTLIRELGHDGTEEIELGGEVLMHGIHIQEVIDLALRRKIALIQVDRHPLMDYGDGNIVQVMEETRFWDYVNQRDGILIMRTHACAWINNKVYDPNGRIGELDQYDPQMFFIVSRII